MEQVKRVKKIRLLLEGLSNRLFAQKSFLLMCLVVFSFVIYLVDDDFVAYDAYEYPADQVIYVTDDTSIDREIITIDKNVHTLMLSIVEPEILKDDENIYIEIYDHNDLLFQSGISIHEALGECNSDGILSVSVGDKLKGVKKHGLSISIRSNVEDTSQAQGFRLDKSGELWTRLSYLIMSKSVARTFFIGIILVLLVVFTLAKKWRALKENKPEQLFLFCSIVLGLLYILIMPMFRVPDSVNHYVRAYGILEGNFLTPKGGQIDIPENLIPYAWYSYTPYILFKHFNMEINMNDVISHNNANMALYSPLSYVFQVIGIGMAKLFSNNTYILVLTGCFANFVGCTILLYFAIKRIPYGKNLLMFISLLPMALQERASLSVDAITYASIIALFALCLSIRYNRSKVTRMEFIILLILILIVSSCKVVYFIAAFLFLIIPKECFNDSKKEKAFKILGMIETISLSVGWAGFAISYLGYTRGGVYDTR